MRQRLTGLIAVAVLLSGLPAAAGPQDRLDGAEQRLEDTDARLEQARQAYEAARQRLAALRGELAGIEDRLADVRQAAADARRRTRRLQERTQQATGRLTDRQRALERQVTETYQRGVSDAGRLWLSVLSSTAGPHDVALAEQASERLLAHDQQLITAARQQRRRTRTARRRAAQAARRAEDRGAEIARLVDRQRTLLADARAQQRRRQAVLDELAADRQVQAALVDRLRRQLAGLAAVLVEARQVSFDQADPAWTTRLPDAGRQWAAEIDAAAARAGINGRFLAALVWTESYFRQDVVSGAGAIGLTQLMPATAASLGVDPHDPIENLSGGARYIREQLEAFRDLEVGLAAYNQGPGAVQEAGGMPDSVAVQLYVLAVLERWRDLRTGTDGPG